MAARDHNSAPLVEPLTRREREVLGLLAQGLTAPEIAAKLTLAVSSVKWHIQHLYGKLGVNNKRQAIICAKELGLLSGPSASHALPPQIEPPPLHNLPIQVTRFFGRETEISQLKVRLAECRLVTLTGPGGVGKTRLALQVAEQSLAGYLHGVWFVELAALASPALVPQAVATTLSLREEPGRPVIESLAHVLRGRQSLIVLDNCEHLLDGCAPLADFLLRACPRLSILASSREPLGAGGEAIFAVPSLPYPASSEPIAAKRVGEYAAVRLFLDRARLVRPDYQVTAHNASAVASICRQLDGIPLAIEMAAAWINTLSTEQIAHRLQDVYRLLTGRTRTALSRHQTLRATLDWSYELLSREERMVLQRLSIFAGGCTAEAAEAVCEGEEVPAGSILDLLASLAAKSMVIAERFPGSETRYLLFEMVRQYAREKLEAAGETARLHLRHRDHFLAHSEAIFPEPTIQAAKRWAKKLGADRENMRQALAWSFTEPGLASNIEAGLRLVLALFTDCDAGEDLWRSQEELSLWYSRSIELCRSRADISAQIFARILIGAAHVHTINDPRTALSLAQEAATICRGLGPEGQRALAQSLCELVTVHSILNEIEQATLASAEAETILLALERETNPSTADPGTMAKIMQGKAGIAAMQGRREDAKRLAGEAIRYYEVTGDRLGSYYPRMGMGCACFALGEYDQAHDNFSEARRLADEWGSVWAIADSGYCVSETELQRGNLEAALEGCRESLRLAVGLPDNNIIAHCLGLAAGIAAEQRHSARAARLSGAAHTLYRKQSRTPWEAWSLDSLLPGWRDGPDAAALQQAYDAGQAMSTDEAVAHALDLME